VAGRWASLVVQERGPGGLFPPSIHLQQTLNTLKGCEIMPDLDWVKLSPVHAAVLGIYHPPRAYGFPHFPDSADRKMASITDIFLMASSRATGTSPLSRIARENTSP
jgi:hypothetical protein